MATTGNRPAQSPSAASGPSPSDGSPSLTFTDASASGSASNRVAANSFRDGRRA